MLFLYTLNLNWQVSFKNYFCYRQQLLELINLIFIDVTHLPISYFENLWQLKPLHCIQIQVILIMIDDWWNQGPPMTNRFSLVKPIVQLSVMYLKDFIITFRLLLAAVGINGLSYTIRISYLLHNQDGQIMVP